MRGPLLGAGAVVAMLLALAYPGAPASAAGTAITAQVTVTKITVGDTTYVQGKVTPSTATGRVVLQRKVGTRWYDRNAALVTTSTGAYKIRLKPSAAGVYTMRVRSNGGSVVSGTVYLKVSPGAQPVPGSPCQLGSHPDCIDPEGDGSGIFLIGGAHCMAVDAPILGAYACSDLDHDGHAGYPDSD